MAIHTAQKQQETQLRLLDEMTDVIIDIADPEKIILFGSQARGRAGPYSDYDFLIVDAQPFGKERSRLEASTKVAWALSRFDVSTDILIFTIEEVEYWSQSLNHVVSCALREGKVLYERPVIS